jgi:membrane protein DedA with SNARE-associated domain
MIEIFKEYGYFILFGWSILEGETGLFMAGLLCYSGDMNLYLAIFVAGLGGFVGDQLYFFIGRYNKSYVTKKFVSQRRKFALAHLLLKKYGWSIIFIQRYMYGLRTIIPISIGLTKYSAKSFAFINLISAWCWASVTIIPVWYFGKEVLIIIDIAKEYWYVVLILISIFFTSLYLYFKSTSIKAKKNNKKVYKKINKQIHQLSQVEQATQSK